MTRHGNVRRMAGVALAALVLLLAGCAPQEGDAPVGPPAGGGGQRAHLDALRDEIGRAPDRPPACHVDDPQAFVRMAELDGDNCVGHRVQIGGHTQACVRERNDRARLNALRRVAAAECASFCASIGCASAALVRQEDCASANARESDECPRARPARCSTTAPCWGRARRATASAASELEWRGGARPRLGSRGRRSRGYRRRARRRARVGRP